MEYNGFLWNKRSGIVYSTPRIMVETHLFVRNPFVGKFSVVGKLKIKGKKDCLMPLLFQVQDR